MDCHHSATGTPQDPKTLPETGLGSYGFLLKFCWIIFTSCLFSKPIIALRKLTGKRIILFIGFGILGTTPFQGVWLARHIIHFGLSTNIPGLSWLRIPPVRSRICEGAIEPTGRYPCALEWWKQWMALIWTAQGRSQMLPTLPSCYLESLYAVLYLFMFFGIAATLMEWSSEIIRQKCVCCGKVSFEKRLATSYPAPAICQTCYDNTTCLTKGKERCIRCKEAFDKDLLATPHPEPPICRRCNDEACEEGEREVRDKRPSVQEKGWMRLNGDEKTLLP
jgi:hypothetical protein